MPSRTRTSLAKRRPGAARDARDRFEFVGAQYTRHNGNTNAVSKAQSRGEDVPCFVQSPPTLPLCETIEVRQSSSVANVEGVRKRREPGGRRREEGGRPSFYHTNFHRICLLELPPSSSSTLFLELRMEPQDSPGFLLLVASFLIS